MTIPHNPYPRTVRYCQIFVQSAVPRSGSVFFASESDDGSRNGKSDYAENDEGHKSAVTGSRVGGLSLGSRGLLCGSLLGGRLLCGRFDGFRGERQKVRSEAGAPAVLSRDGVRVVRAEKVAEQKLAWVPAASYPTHSKWM